MSLAPNWQEKLSEAEAAVRSALAEPEFEALARQFRTNFKNPSDCYAALSQINRLPGTPESLKEHTQTIEASPILVARWLLLQASLHAFPKIAPLPVHEGVKSLWADMALFWSRPSPSPILSFHHERFREMSRIVTLRRFPAGQFHWELSGLPRSYILRTKLSKWHRLFTCITTEGGGFSPMFETHVNALRTNRLTLSEYEALRSYFLLAKSLEQQPTVKGLFTESWLYCESTAKVSPHLAWLRDFFRSNGAFLASTRPAPVNSGFMKGSKERRKLYQQGLYCPKMTYVVWPRMAMLNWVREFERDVTNRADIAAVVRMNQ